MRPRPPHRRESAKHSKDHSPLNSRKFFRSLSLCFPTSKTRLEIHEMIETGMKYLAQSPHTLYDHLAEEAPGGAPGLPGASGGRGWGDLQGTLHIRSYEVPTVTQHFLQLSGSTVLHAGTILPPPPRDNGQCLETSGVVPTQKVRLAPSEWVEAGAAARRRPGRPARQLWGPRVGRAGWGDRALAVHAHHGGSV